MNGYGMRRSFLPGAGGGLMGGRGPIAVIPHGGQIPWGILAKRTLLSALYSPQGVFQFHSPLFTFSFV